MYKNHTPKTEIGQQFVVRVIDNAFIPFDQANADYKAYLTWLEEGNTPEPAEGI